MTEMVILAKKLRRSLRNGTGLNLTRDEARALANAGALKLVADAEVAEIIASLNSPP